MKVRGSVLLRLETLMKKTLGMFMNNVPHMLRKKSMRRKATFLRESLTSSLSSLLIVLSRLRPHLYSFLFMLMTEGLKNAMPRPQKVLKSLSST